MLSNFGNLPVCQLKAIYLTAKNRRSLMNFTKFVQFIAAILFEAPLFTALLYLISLSSNEGASTLR